MGRYRVIIVEDADRLTERAADALLKALEEPVPRTVWMLCAPSVEDVIITIRSRSRHVRLRTPSVEAVADLLTRRDGIDPPMALYAARAAQSHVGLARRLARDEHARIRRHDVITLATKIVSVGDAIGAAGDLMTIAAEESAAASSERDAAERVRSWRCSAPTRPRAPSRRTSAPARLAGEGAEGPGHPLHPRRHRPGSGRPALGLPRRPRAAHGLGTALVNEDSRQVVQRVASCSAPTTCSGRWTPSAPLGSGSAPTSTRSSPSRRWPSTCACR